MKKIFILLLVTAAFDCHAATGAARDAELLAGIIIAIIFLIAGIGYFADMLKHKIRDARDKKMENKCNQEGEELLNSFIGTVPGAHA